MKQGLLRRLFNIYPGEEKNAILFACLGFLWAFGVTCGQKFADALFLLHVGSDYLPQAYMLTACGMLIVASVLLYAFHRFSSYAIFSTVVLLGICFYSFVFINLISHHTLHQTFHHTFWFSLKIAGYFLFSILMTCYWTFIDQYHHLQDAKRLYSLFSSMIFLGAASTGLVMHSGLLDLHHLILLIISLLTLTYLWIRKIAHDLPVISHEDHEPEGIQTAQPEHSFRFLIRSILNSRFTLLLMASNFITQLLLVITEYNYMSTFQDYFSSIPDQGAGEGTEASLTLFLGQALASVSASNLLIGLFIYSRLVRRFGITSLLTITPLLLIISFAGWSFSESLFFPLIGFFVVEGTLYVIDDSNFNLLLNAVPSKLKYKIRVMIESFFEPIGMLISATLLTFLQHNSRWLGLALAACSLIIAMALKSQYLKALFFNLSDNAIHFQKTVEEWLSKLTNKQQIAAEHKLLAILRSGDEQAQLFACEGLLAFEDPSILRKLLSYASQMKVSAKIKFIALVEQSVFAKDNLVLDALQTWILHDLDAHLKGTIYFYLAKQGLLHPDKVTIDLKSSNIQLQGAAIVSLKKSLAYLPPGTAAYNRTLAAHHLKLLLDSPREEEIRMGLYLLGIEGDSHDVDILLSYLKHPSLQIAQTAAKSIAQALTIDSIRQAPLLIEQLSLSSDYEIRSACLKALEKMDDSSLVPQIIQASIHFRPHERRLTETIIYRMGLKTVPTLLALTKDKQMPDRCRVLAGRILGRLSLPQLRANLSDIIQKEIERAYFYFYHANTIQQLYPDEDLSLLTDALMTGYHSVIDFIIQLLGVAGEVEDCELLSRSIRSRNPKVRSQVVETLEKTCETKIFRLLQPLVDDIPQTEKMRAYVKSGHQPLSLSDLLDKMGDSSAQVDRIISAAMKYHLNLPTWRESLRQQMLQQDEIFHHFAYELLES